MNCLVTAGPTYEPLDEVRRLTNFSTGRLGSELASYLSGRGHRVTLLRGYYAVHLAKLEACRVLPFTTTADLRDQLRALSTEQIDAVFHAAAVSDFGFGRVFARSEDGELTEQRAGKLSTRQGTLLAELVPTPKIISELREWFPLACLVGWKFEVDGTQAGAVGAGLDQVEHCRTDGCVVNGPAYGEGFGWLPRGSDYRHLPDIAALCQALADYSEAKCSARK